MKAYLKKFSRRKPEETKDKEETRAEKSAVQAAGEEEGAAGKPGQPEKAAAGKTEQSMEAAAKRPEEPKKGSASGKKKAGFGDYATTAMFIGLCGAYIGSYVGRVTAFQEYTPLFTAVISAAVMYIFEYFTIVKKKDFSISFLDKCAKMIMPILYTAKKYIANFTKEVQSCTN